MSRGYPHTATLWMRDGEGSDRRGRWRRRVLDGVRWAENRGASAGPGGDVPKASWSAVVPMVFSGYVDPARLADGRALGGAEWTIRRGDRMALGESFAASPPPSARTVEASETVCKGRRPHHVEAAGS